MDDYSSRTPQEMCDILAEKVLQAKIPAMIVTMGAEGAVYADMSGDHGICPARNVQVKDTTGAGDSFNAGFLSAFISGKPLEECIDYGLASGSISVTRLGSAQSCPNMSEVMEMIAADIREE